MLLASLFVVGSGYAALDNFVSGRPALGIIALGVFVLSSAFLVGSCL